MIIAQIVVALADLISDLFRGKSGAEDAGRRLCEAAVATGVNPNTLASYLNNAAIRRAELAADAAMVAKLALKK